MNLLDELRDVLRSLRRAPRIVLLAATCLGVGIGTAAAMFLIVDTFFLRPPRGVRQPDQIVRVYFDVRLPDGRQLTTERGSYAVYSELRSSVPFSEFAAYYPTDVSEGRGEGATKLHAALASTSFFDVLGVRAAIGRGFTHAAGNNGDAPGAMISDALWTNRFGRDPDVLGRRLTIGSKSYAIIGVAPRTFTGIDLQPVDVWLPLEIAANDLIMPGYLSLRGAMAISIIGRVKPGVAPATLAAAVTSSVRASMALTKASGRYRALIGPILGELGPNPSNEARVSLWLGGVAVAVLLIAVLNCGVLLLVRALNRAPETGMRAALGATSARLIRAACVESVVIGLAAAVVGATVALAAAQGLRGFLLPEVVSHDRVALVRMLWFAGATGAILGVMIGVAVTLATLRRAEITGLAKSVRRAQRRGGRSVTRSVLLGVQVALTTVLIGGAYLFVRSLQRASDADLGFDPHGVTVVTVDFAGMTARLNSHGESHGESQAALFERLERTVRQIPGVTSVTIANDVPFKNITAGMVSIPGRDSASLTSEPVQLQFVGSDYATTLALGIRAGRWFNRADYHSGGATAVINQTLAERYWPGESAIGQCVSARGEPRCRTIIGIVRDTRIMALRERPRGQLYLSDQQDSTRTLLLPSALLVRSARADIVLEIRSRVVAANPSLAYLSVLPLDTFVAPSMRPWRLGAMLLLACSGIALLLATFGLFGSTHASLNHRTPELSIRAALGADSARIATLVFSGVALATVAGLAAGCAMFFIGARHVEPLLYGITSHDPWAFVTPVVVVAVAATGACLPVFIRATRLDLVRVLNAV